MSSNKSEFNELLQGSSDHSWKNGGLGYPIINQTRMAFSTIAQREFSDRDGASVAMLLEAVLDPVRVLSSDRQSDVRVGERANRIDLERGVDAQKVRLCHSVTSERRTAAVILSS